jgi:hypothetical protein
MLLKYGHHQSDSDSGTNTSGERAEQPDMGLYLEEGFEIVTF